MTILSRTNGFIHIEVGALLNGQTAHLKVRYVSVQEV